MNVFGTMFNACCLEAVAMLPPDKVTNASVVASLCELMTLGAIHNHDVLRVLDFEQIAPVLPAWWINGLFFVIVLSATVLLSFISIHIFLDSSMRSPTNILLTAITALDLLTCLFQAPINVHEYLMESYRELPSYTWCRLYFYIHNFLPASFHGSAFLLNMYLSIQRYVGIKGVKGCHCVGTYKGTIIAIITCLITSFSIHSMYPAMVALEEVTAISKKVLSANGFYYIQSCRVVDRFGNTSKGLFSAYMWMRVVVLQVPPAMVLSVCNIALIRVSYKTHIYRKRLVGAVGIIASSRLSSTRDTSSITIVSDTVSLSGRRRRSSSVISCSRQGITTERPAIRDDCTVDERKPANESRKKHNWTLTRNGKVAPITPHANLADVTGDRLDSAEHKETNGGVALIEACHTITKLSRDTHKQTCGLQLTSSRPNGDMVYDKHVEKNLDLILVREILVENQHSGSANALSENNNGHTSCDVVRDSSRETRKMSFRSSCLKQDNYIHINDVSLFDVFPEQVAFPDMSHSGTLLENSRRPSVTNRGAEISSSLPELEVQLNGRNDTSSCKHRSPDRNNSRGRQSYKMKIHRNNAEIRSTVMLLLVTSCTLVFEVFVIIVLLLKFLKSISAHDSEFLSYSDLASLMMAYNMMMVINFPINFIFFCGLSQAFRSLLKIKLNALMRKIKLRP